MKYLNERDHERNKFLRPEQINRLLKAAKASGAKSYLPLAILLVVEHGASKQEILDLTWRDIDFHGNTIRVYRTKNKQERFHQIMPRTRKALEERIHHLKWLRKRKSIIVMGDHVVGHLDGTRMGSFYKAWKGICADHDYDDLHFHDGRHTSCSNILMSGGSLKDAKEMIGHKPIQMTNRYTHLDGIRAKMIQDGLARHYGIRHEVSGRTHSGHRRWRRED